MLAKALLFLGLLIGDTCESGASDFYLAKAPWAAKHHEKTWRDMPFQDRVEMLAQDGISIWMEGEIKAGDFAELLKIHSLAPVHTLIISSPGGSVSEAFKKMRAKLGELKELLDWFEYNGLSTAIIATYIKNPDWKESAAKEIRERQEQLRIVGTELRKKLPIPHFICMFDPILSPREQLDALDDRPDESVPR
jgi:hypothetical protein